jgi:D-threo-aldose 1-dehydrogenase
MLADVKGGIVSAAANENAPGGFVPGASRERDAVIPTIRLGRSEILTSRLGFGTSRLHLMRSSQERQRILAETAALGIRHFDTAPIYGDGLAERELGVFLRGQAGSFTVATKFGIPPSALIEMLPPIATPLRAARAVFRRLGVAPAQLPPLTAESLRRSLHASLRRLRLERIDLLMIHEPTLARLPDARALCDELLTLRQRGVIRDFGLAGSWRDLVPIVTAHPALAGMIQTGEHEWSEPSATIPDITFGAVSGGRPQGRFHRQAIDPDAAARSLRAALARRPRGLVLVSTTSPEHLRLLARSAAD